MAVEFSSSDWVDDLIDMAATAGADLVYILGLDNPSRIERAVRTARHHRLGIILAIPNHADPTDWCATVTNAGADAISIIRNIDSAESSTATATRIRQVAECATIPLAISGGFTANNLSEILDDNWSVLIIGGAFVHAREPGEALLGILRAAGVTQ